MPRRYRIFLPALGIALILCGTMIAKLAIPGLFRRVPSAVAAETAPPPGRIRFAVLGDSDSQSYHDTLTLGRDARGGPWRPTTWQWTEVLAQLRGHQLDLGDWGAWGSGKYRAYIEEAAGKSARTPRKEDYRYDYAVSGATCGQLMGHSQRQAIRLDELMDIDPQAWRGGVVLIRIGINDVGQHDVLDELSRDPNASRPNAIIDACLKSIGDAVALLRKQHPDTNVALIGILSNADWSVEFDNWQSANQIANIDAGLDRFDAGLRKIAAGDRHVAFFDDRAWFRSQWGARDDHGRPVYKTVKLSPGWVVTNTSGDNPHNAVLNDGHAGVVWNTLWAQHMVAALDKAFGLSIKPISDAEVIDFLQPSFASGAK